MRTGPSLETSGASFSSLSPLPLHRGGEDAGGRKRPAPEPVPGVAKIWLCLPGCGVDVKRVELDRKGRVFHVALKERVENILPRLFVEKADKGLLAVLVNQGVDMAVKGWLRRLVLAREVDPVLSHLEVWGRSGGAGLGGGAV